MDNSESKLTSVKIIDKNYKDFKRLTIDSDITLQKIINRSIDLYLKDHDFRNKINLHNTCGMENSKF